MMLRAFLILLLASLAAPLAAQTCPSGNPRVAPDSRYEVSTPDPSGHPNERVVRDLRTGLEWKQCSEGQTGTACTGTASSLSWSAALGAAQPATWAGHTDWRLPNINELSSLVETGCYSPSINTTVFPGTPNGHYWSSTTFVPNASDAWYAAFNGGGLVNGDKGGSRQVRLVRGGQWLDPLHTLSYSAGANGSLSGNTSQTVVHGADGAAVTAVPDTGYHFVSWSDGATANPRTDKNVQSDITVTANFAADPVIGPITWAANSATSIVYDGSARSASASVDSGYSLSFSYNSSPTAPSDAGSYTVVASVNELPGITRSETLTITKATGTVAWGTLDFDYSNTPHTVSATHGGTGGACTVTPASIGPAVGSYALSANCVGDANHEDASGSATATIGGAKAVHRVRDHAYFASVADALADAGTQAGDTLELAPGTYSGGIVLTKGVKLVGSTGFTPLAGPTTPPSVVIDGGNVVQDGITIAASVTGASVSGLEIRNFTRYCVHGVSGNHGLSIAQSVLHHCADSGVWINGDVDYVTIDHNEVYDFGFGSGVAGRGIVIWNGAKRDITISNNHVHDGAGCCGIELQDGTATGAWITDNVVANVGDSGMGFVQLGSGSPTPRANIISGNEITNTGRFGIELKIPNGTGAASGDGAIIVENNIIDGGGAVSLRDRAGIAVFRRAFASLPGQVDVTQGVVVQDNSVSGFRTSLAGYEGYGIVVEGLGSTVQRNALGNNDIGFQLQQGNPDGTPPGDANQNANNDWFGRGNAPFTCASVGESADANTYSANTTDQREIPIGTPMIGSRVTNQNTGARYCTITSAVAAASNGDTILVDAGTHAENVVVTRPVTINGAGQALTTIVPATYNPDCSAGGGSGSMCTGGTEPASVVFLVRASNVEIADLGVDGINPDIPGHATDIAARNGIMSDITGGAYTNFKVHDTHVRNIYLRGIYSPSNNGSFEFSDNLVENVDSDPSSIAIFSFYGSGVVERNTVSNVNDAIAANWSRGVQIRDNVISGARSGIHTDNSHGSGGGADDVIEGNTVSCNRDDAYGIFTFATYADVTVQDNQVSACAVGLGAFSGRTDDIPPLHTSYFIGNSVSGLGATVSTPGDQTLGAWLSTTSFYWGEHDNQAELSGNVISDFGVGLLTQRGGGRSLATTAHRNRLSGNTVGWQDDGDAVGAGNGASDLVNNWWGCNDSPDTGAGCAAAAGTGDFDPWLVLRLPAGPIEIARGASVPISADLNHNSDGDPIASVFPDGTSIAFAADNGASVTTPQPTAAGVATTNFSGLTSGQSNVSASLENATAQVLVRITQATITLDGPLTRTYDGSAQVVTATVAPPHASASYQVTYDGSLTPPTAAGSYAVVASITDTCCEGSASGTLVIQRAATTIEFLPNAPSFVYDGNAHDGDVSARLAAEPGTSCPVTGAIGPNVGSYPVNAAACTGTNHEAPAAGTTATVTAQPTTISFSHLVQAYDGSPKSVVATTAPTSGVPLVITYDGSPTPPTAVGSYSVVASVTDPNYSGSNSATLQIVNGTGDIALVLNGPVDPIHVGDTAQYAATMLANPALHTGELYGYHVVLSKSGGSSLALTDLASMEIWDGTAWQDASALMALFTLDGSGNLVYDFPDGIPGYPGGFPILDASWTWNVRFGFATPGTYTLSTTLTDGIGGPAIVPTVAASIATVVLDALPATDIHLALGGPAESIEVAQVAEYTGTLIADPSLHVGEDFFVKVTISKSGGHALVPADLATMEMYYGGSWVALPPGEITQPGGPGTELLYHFPKPAMPGGFEITSPTWTWNFRFGYADVGVYTAVAEVIHASDEGNPLAHVFATAAVSTTVIDATPHLPDLGLLLTGPLDDIELGDAAQYTGTLLAEPALHAGHNFWVRIRISKSGGSHALTATDLAKMELYAGGWQDHTATLQPLLVADGADLVYYFPQPFGAFPIDNAIFSWNFRFTYGDTGVYTATADLIDAADPVPLTAPALASASVETTVIDTPDIQLDVQGAVTGMVGTPVQYVGTLSADPLPPSSNLYYVEVRIQRDGAAAAATDVAKAEIYWGGQWVDPVADLGLTIPWTIDGDELVYLFPQPIMPAGFPIDEPTWTWQFRFTYANAGLYTATATVITADGSATPVSNTESIHTDVSVLAEDIQLTLNGPVAGVEVEAPTAYIGRLQNLGGDLAENGYVHVRIDMAGQVLVTSDVTLEVWDGGAWVTGPVSEVADGLEVAFPDATGFAIPAGFDFTHQFRITYHRTGVFHATATVVGATSGDSYASAEMFTEVVPQAILTASVLFDPASLHAVYDGMPHAASATTLPAGLALDYTYNGSSTPPTAAGSYVVQATVNDSLYQGSATAVLVIDKANGSVSLAPLSGVYGSAHAVTATLVETDTNVTCAVAGVPAANAPVGSYALVATCEGDNYTATTGASYVVTPVAAGNSGIVLTGGVYTYDGAAHAAGVSNPNGVAHTLAYAPGGAAVPVDAGTYDVTLTITDANYAPETLTAQVVIAPASVTLAFGNLTQVYDGAPKAASVTATPDVGGISLAYSQGGSPVTPVAAGSYDVAASLANPNYVLGGATTATLVIARAAGTVTFGPTNFTFDGSAHAMTAVITQEPGNLAACVLTPVGDDPRVHAGSTTYSAACSGDNYLASGSTTLNVAPKPVTIALSDLGPYVYDGAAHAATASVTGAVAGFPATVGISYNGDPTPPSAVGSYNVVATLDLAVTDYVATPASGVLVIGAGNASVTLGDLAAVYDGNPHAASVVTTPAGLAVDVTYDGNTTAPTNAGSYSVVATITEPGYSGSASGTLTIAKAAATVTISDTTQAWDGTPRAVTVVTSPTGLSVDVTYDGSTTAPSAVGSYAVLATVTDANHSGSANATLTITHGAADSIVANGPIAFTGVAGQPLAGGLPSVKVTDAGGNPVAGVAITFSAGLDSGTLTGAMQTTDQNGIATLGGWILDATPGTNTLVASAAGVVGNVGFSATGAPVTGALSVTKTDGRSGTQVGRLLTYTITVGNGGSADANGVLVEDSLPDELAAATAHWQCIPVNGATCTSSGSGDLLDTIDLPAGSSAVYLLTARVVDDIDGMIDNTVTVTFGTEIESASDSTEIVIFRDGFELSGDGAEWGSDIEPLATGSLSEAQAVTFTVAPGTLAQLQRVVLAQAVDRSFQVEAIAIGKLVLVRLLAGDQASAWSVLDGEHVALVLLGSRLSLVGAQADLSLAVGGGGPLPVELFTRH